MQGVVNMEKDLKNHGLQIIKHPSYEPYGKRLISWFDIRVFYIRVNNFMVDGYTPEYFTLKHRPLDPDTVIEVNGKRCTLQSEVGSCRLKRNRVDKRFEEATFVTTDSVRLSGSVKFEVLDGEDVIISGALEMFDDKWSMSCESMVCGSYDFFKDKQTVGCDSMLPMIEVYVAGSFSGAPVILTKTLQMAGYGDFKNGKDDYYDNSLMWSQREFMEGEDGALSWFNAGVKVGVGLGLGVCLGVGVGVGLLVRTYQSTSRIFRKRF
ncbi:uncharacterized protein At1g01500-like [Bidens hawaiensis]|uniref:uncharacterized protein At1g01500-like n=1 Tax=Bidens hawaiensis TaxID=980011 RepID=UPI0040491559